jgi:hypothetical protein
MAIDDQRGTTAIQGYDPEDETRALDGVMGAQPPGELRIEMESSTLEWLLAQHLTDDAVERILAMRASMRTPV